MNSSARQDVLDLLFPDSGVTINDILTHLNYRLVPEAMMDGFDAKSNIIEKIAIRVMATLERFVSEDSTPNRSSAEKASEAIKKLAGEINKVIDNNKNDNNPKQTLDDVVGLKSESEVQHQIEQAENYGGGRPSAAPTNNLSTNEDTSREISLSDLGFSDSELNEEFGAITFTTLNGTLTFNVVDGIASFTYNNNTINAGQKNVVVLPGQKINIAWIKGGVFTYTPSNNQSGDAQLTYRVEAKEKGQAYNSDSPVDEDPNNAGTNLQSAPVTMTITVNPVNDTPTDTALSGVAVLRAIQGVITAKDTLDDALADGAFATAQAALQKALDALIDLNIGGRPVSEVSQGDQEKVAEFIAATKALIVAGTTAGDEAADKAAYDVFRAAATARTDDDAAITNDGAFTTLATETRALKVAEVYRVADGVVHLGGNPGGNLTSTDVEDAGLDRLSALNAAKKAIDALPANAPHSAGDLVIK